MWIEFPNPYKQKLIQFHSMEMNIKNRRLNKIRLTLEMASRILQL